MRHFWQVLVICVLWAAAPASAWGQDTIYLKGDTIRVGELEWDMEKDHLAKGAMLSDNKDLYGENVKIFLGYHSNRMVEQIVFGYLEEDKFVPHGPARYYYDSGHLLSKRYYESGVMDGPAYDYYKDGKVMVKTQFVDDLLHGPYISYHDGGALDQQGVYDAGAVSGAFRSYYSNGKLKWVEYYDSTGVKEGVDSTFYETGRLESVFSFEEGVESGAATFYHRNGQVWSQRTYEEGRLMEVEFIHDAKGKSLEVGNFSGGRGWVNVYNDTGKLLKREKYKDGFLRKVKRAK